MVKRVVGAAALLGLIALGTGGPGCAGSPEDSPSSAPSDAGEPLPAGFAVWLRAQCPDDGALRVTTDASVREAACATIRAEILTDESMREQFVRAYTALTTETTSEAPAAEPPPAERTDEAREPGVISGFFCGLLVNALISYQCNKVNYHWGSCVAASIPPSILCAIIPLP
jgi:hypothetical protein